MVIVNFIRDPEVGIFARVKRPMKDRSANKTASDAKAGCAKLDDSESEECKE